MQKLIIIIEHSKTLSCSSKPPWARERIFFFFEIYKPFGHAPSESFAIPVIRLLQRVSEILFFVPSCEQRKMV